MRTGPALRAMVPLALAATLLHDPRPARADDGDAYARALTEAAALDAQHRWIEAARALEAIVPLYPQDYALALQLAWTYFRMGMWADAERCYRVALELAGGAPEPRLGLGLSLEQQRRCDEARGYLRPLAEGRSEARDALARCAEAPAFQATIDGSLTGQLYPVHPYKASSLGGALSSTVTHRSGVYLGGTYRYGRYSPPSTASNDAWSQNEGFINLGYARPRYGVGLTYGVVSDGSGVFGTSHHLGLTGRVSPFGDIVVALSASLYPDLTVLRAEPSWKIPITAGFSIKPAVAFQDAGGDLRITGSLGLALDRPGWSAFAGGKYGAETRPAYLDLGVVYDVPEQIEYGLWTGGSVNVGSGFRIHGSYAFDRLRMDATSTSLGYTVNGHTLTLGTTLSF